MDIGATAKEVVKLLGEGDSYYMFDREEKVNPLLDELTKITKAEVIPMGNSDRVYDSYNWSLMKLWKEKGERLAFDAVYLDAAHTFIHDALTCCILKEMMATNGIILFDDLDWMIWNSPTCNPTVNPKFADRFTEEQQKTAQVKIATEMFMDTDKRYVLIDELSSNRRCAYRKING